MSKRKHDLSPEKETEMETRTKNMAGTKRTRHLVRSVRIDNSADRHITQDETTLHPDEGRVHDRCNPLPPISHDSGTFGTREPKEISRRPDSCPRLGQQFWIKFPGYGSREILTVRAVTPEGITCHSTRYGEGVDIPNAALRLYERQIIFVPTESDYRHAADMAEQALSNADGVIRYEEVQDEQGVAA
jgi:hypothetical protein